MLYYDVSLNEIRRSTAPMSTAKAFIIDHPTKESNYLVHTCLEGPEIGVYYRGKSEIIYDNYTTVNLPYYVKDFAYDFTIQVTAIYDGKVKNYAASEVINNSFNVYGDKGKFYWVVYGKRGDIDVEPFKSVTNVRGNGPYKYI